MGKRDEKRFIERRTYVAHNEKIIRSPRTGIAIKALAVSLSLLGLTGIGVAIGLHFGTSSPSTLSTQISPTVNSTAASLIKIDSRNILRRTVDDQEIGVVLATGSSVTGPITSSKQIAEFTNGNEFVTKAYVDSVNNANTASSDSIVRQSYVATQLSTALPLAGGTISGALRTSRSSLLFENNEFVTKAYVDDLGNLRVSLTGSVLTGPLTTNRANDEFGNTELVTKSYTDATIATLNTNIRAEITTQANLRLLLTGGALTGALKTTRDTFDANELVDKKYVDDNVNSALYEQLVVTDTNPLIGTTNRYYATPGFNPTACTVANTNNFGWSGWINSVQAQPLVDATPGLTSPDGSTPSTNTNHAVRGFLSYFGVEYSLAKRIEANPENVRIAFRVKDLRGGITQGLQTAFFNLMDLSNTEIAANFVNPSGVANTNYRVVATYDNVAKTIAITSTFNGEANCAVSVDGIVLSGATRNDVFDAVNNNQPAVPYFRTS